MKPVDYRNETWQGIQDRLSAQRVAVWHAWQQYGPDTTRQVSRKSGIDILTLRPRTTELCQLGLVVVAEDAPEHAHEGRYRALTEDEARALFAERQQAARTPLCQPELKLSTSSPS